MPFDPGTASNQRGRWPMYYIAQFKWTGTPTAKLVTELGFNHNHLDFNELYQDGIEQPRGTGDWFRLTKLPKVRVKLMKPTEINSLRKQQEWWCNISRDRLLSCKED